MSTCASSLFLSFENSNIQHSDGYFSKRWPNLYHPGPATAWLSPAPGSLNQYAGDGEWFKILSVVGRTEQSEPPNDEYFWKHQWGTYQAKSVSVLCSQFFW